MEPVVVDEDSVHYDVDSSEETNTAMVKDQAREKSEQESSSDSVGSSLVDSVKSMSKSTSELLPASLGGSTDQTEGEASPVSEQGINSDGGKEAQASELSIGDYSSRPDQKVMEESSLGDTVTDVTAEGWAVVDPFPQEEATNVQAQEEEEIYESGDPNLSVHAQCFASNATPGPDIQEEDSQTTTSPFGYVSDGPFVRSSSLRRRPRSFPKGRKDDGSVVSSVGAHISRFSESIDIAAIAESPAAFEPQDDRSSGASGELEVESQLQNEDGHGSVVCSIGAHISRFSESIDIAAIAESPAAFEPQDDRSSGASGELEIESQLQNEDGRSVSKAESSHDLTEGNNSEFRNEKNRSSGYDPELEDDDNDASSASSREAGEDLWKRRRSQPEEGWEEIASSSDLEGKMSIADTKQRREVYKMPGSDGEGEYNGGESPPQVLAQPAGLVVRAVEFQLNLIVHMLAIGIWLVNFTLSTLSHPISRTVEVKDKVTNVTTGAANQVLEVFSSFGDGILQAGPTANKLSKKIFWGCLGVAYVICILGFLLIPALFVDIVIVNSMVEEPVVIRQALDFDFTQSRPVALLPLFPTKEIERIKNLPPDKAVKTRVIPVGNKFHITVVLTLPESDYNMNLGMFQLTAELLSARDQVLLRSSKPCRLRFRSFPMQLVKTLLFAVPHLVGFSKEAQTIEIRLLEAEERATPTASVRILIEPKASFRDGGGVPDIYEAKARLESNIPWPRAIISSWKWLFFIWNGVCVFLFEVAIVLCCCRQILVPSFARKTVAEEKIVQGEVKDERATREVSRENRSSRKGRSNRRVYFEDGIPGAAGARDCRGTGTLKNQGKGDGAEGIVEDELPPS